MTIKAEIIPAYEAGSCSFCNRVTGKVLQFTIHNSTWWACPLCTVEVRNGLNDLTTLINIKLISFK